MATQPSPTDLLRRAYDWRGRANRLEYLLLVFAAAVLLAAADLGPAWLLVPAFVLLAPVQVMATTRRLHDIDKSGWHQLYYLIPLIGFVLWLLLFFYKGDPAANRFGPPPRGPVPDPAPPPAWFAQPGPQLARRKRIDADGRFVGYEWLDVSGAVVRSEDAR